MADAAQAELGAVDVLVNNAATEPQIRFHILSPSEIEYVRRVDLTTPLLLSRLLHFPGMGPAINRLSGADKLMASVAEQREAARARKIAANHSRTA